MRLHAPAGTRHKFRPRPPHTAPSPLLTSRPCIVLPFYTGKGPVTFVSDPDLDPKKMRLQLLSTHSGDNFYLVSKFIARISHSEPCLGTASGHLELFDMTHKLTETHTIKYMLPTRRSVTRFVGRCRYRKGEDLYNTRDKRERRRAACGGRGRHLYPVWEGAWGRSGWVGAPAVPTTCFAPIGEWGWRGTLLSGFYPEGEQASMTVGPSLDSAPAGHNT